jgi:hypothetical protein
MRRLKIFIWHVHGSYLYYLTQMPHDFYVPSKPDRKGDYAGRYGHLPWGSNVIDVPVDEIKNLDLDCIIFQLPGQYLHDQFLLFSAEQQHLPKIYLEHDPPLGHPTNSKHFVNDPHVLVVHVSDFNRLMWDNGLSPTCVIGHGVMVPDGIAYSGELDKGIVVVNHLKLRDRRLGKDIYERVSEEVPLDLVGMAAEELPGGLGEVLHQDLFAFESRYRFFFNPIRYTSFPLALCEAMMIGLPVVALGTTQIALAIENGVTGYVDTRVETLIERMKFLVRNPEKAKELGKNAQAYAREHFNIDRFISDWQETIDIWIRTSGYQEGPLYENSHYQ